jgi:hypothetical protein
MLIMKAPVRSLAALLFILISFQARPVAAQSAVTVINNGPVANRVDLVILGDGYTAAELNKYATDVEGVINGFFQQEPFREYQRYFNVHRIDVVSNESGADHPELTPPIQRDTALDGAYNCAGIQRLICVNTTKVQTIASALLSPAARDIILVIVNDTAYGGSGGAVGVASIHPSAIELVLHELGHSFGLLTDEYGGPPPPACVPSIEPPAANATMQTERALIKWNLWIDAATPIPTPGTAPGVPGLYLGAAYCDAGLYRPTFNSKMRSLGRPYEQINAEQLIRRIYNLVTPIEAVQPAESSISFERGEQREFSAITPQPLTQPLDLAWLVDGVAQGSGPSFSLDSTTLAPGDHTIELIARDLTAMVRQDPAQLLVDRRSWRVSVRDPSLRLLRATPASAAPGAKAEISVELAAQGDEHRLSFSLNFDPSILTAPQASLGADAASATLVADATQVAQGRFGVSLTLPEGQVFAAGARRVVIVNLTVAAGAGATKTLVGFGDQPVAQAVFGLSGPALGATYAPGVVAINSRTVQGASAASYSVAGMPAASIASVFGVALADGTESAQDFPLPTTLAGATVRITDSRARRVACRCSR